MWRVVEFLGHGLAHFLTKPMRQSIQVATISTDAALSPLQSVVCTYPG
ncbi:MAG: hypothetical protein WAU15_04800 [Nitrosomonas sp.]